jgi:transmembrane sensor
MKWDEIHDQSRVVVDKAIENLLAEGKEVEKKENDIVEKLRDVEYVGKKLEKRKRYSGKDAFLRLKHQMERRKRLRVAMWMASAACVAVVCVILLQWKQIEVLLPKTSTIVKQENIFPAEMKAILVRADGEQVVLGKEYRNWEEIGNVLIAADSTGLEYNRLKQTNADTVVFNQLIVPRGGLYLLVLADGTRVWMNSDSHLKYPVMFAGGKREVILSGEAFFDVVKDESVPFIVKTETGNIEVLGTEFNIKCYPDEASLVTTLVNGKVRFDDGINPSVILKPEEQLIFEKENGLSIVRKVNVNYYTSWKENRLSFQEETLDVIMKTLSRWYDVEIVFEDSALKELEFSGNLDKFTGIQDFLSLFELGVNVKFEVKNRTVYIRKGN